MELPVENFQGCQLSIDAPPDFAGIDRTVDREDSCQRAQPQCQEHRQSGPMEGVHATILLKGKGKSGAIIAG
jgi:hypothetical protein